MNCDQVFDVLTRGPFPTGTACDEPLEAHLNECPACRRLAEALRPALELFQEAVDPEESRDLPGYWSAAATEGQAVVSYASEVESCRAAQRGAAGAPANRTGNWSALAAWRMAAMLAIGVTLGLLLSARSALDGFGWSPFGASARPAPLAPPADEPKGSLADRLQLASLPAACLRSKPDSSPRDLARSGPGRRDQLPLATQLAQLDCCSGCHNAESKAAVPATATMKVAQSCQLCHNDQRLWKFDER
jgi:hypothetical protein